MVITPSFGPWGDQIWIDMLNVQSTRGRLVVKTGLHHLRSLRDGRAVYIDGAVVADVTTHPAFRNSIRSVASLYDFQAAADHIDTVAYAIPDTEGRVNRAWQLPTSYQELVSRRQALEL